MLTGQGPLRGHPPWCWPRALRSLGGEDSPVLVSDLPRLRKNSTRPQLHFLDATFPRENTGWSTPQPPHPRSLPHRELLPALLLCHLGGICASVELALHLTESRVHEFAVTSEALGKFDFFTGYNQPPLCSRAGSGPAGFPTQFRRCFRSQGRPWGRFQAVTSKCCLAMRINLPEP